MQRGNLMFMFLTGCVSFLLFALNDLNDGYLHNRSLRFLYPAGAAILTFSSIMQLREAMLRAALTRFFMASALLTAAVALVFLAITVHALFFALPGEASYLSPGERRSVCCTGPYALCRHPAVLSFAMMYITLSTGLGFPVRSTIVYITLNILLSLFEDMFVFERIIDGYTQYKENTPFLLPRVGALRKMLRGRGSRDEI